MKSLSFALAFIVAALLATGLSGLAGAQTFHNGGVAECAGCHAMHEPGGQHLMKFSTPSDTCLDCHGSDDYGQLATTGAAYRSGGNYYWVKKTFTWSEDGQTFTSEGDRHGHNIKAPLQGIAVDATNTRAPVYDVASGSVLRDDPGAFDAELFGCNSCHDPHGEQHNEVLLYGAGDVAGDGIDASGNAVSPGLVFGDTFVMNAAGRTTNVDDTTHSAYRQNSAAWCATCHTDFDDSSNKHVTDHAMLSGMLGQYNTYDGTDDAYGTSGYWELVPVEHDALATDSTGDVPSGSRVVCMSCHRAHASAFEYCARWDFGETLLAESHPAAGDGGVTGTDVIDSYYGRTWSVEQRSLCNKCHGKDPM